jgi:hypothetical protein
MKKIVIGTVLALLASVSTVSADWVKRQASDDVEVGWWQSAKQEFCVMKMKFPNTNSDISWRWHKDLRMEIVVHMPNMPVKSGLHKVKFTFDDDRWFLLGGSTRILKEWEGGNSRVDGLNQIFIPFDRNNKKEFDMWFAMINSIRESSYMKVTGTRLPINFQFTLGNSSEAIAVYYQCVREMLGVEEELSKNTEEHTD